MKLKPKSKRRPIKKPSFRVGCPFCYEYLPVPEKLTKVFTAYGALGGTCKECGAYFIFEESGRLGGAAVLDLQAMATDGDLDAALLLKPGIDCVVKSKNLNGASRGRGPTAPQAWALKMGPPAPKRKRRVER